MGTLHRLPTRWPGPEIESVFIEPPDTPDECEGILHVFEGVPGQCQCGTATWETDGTLDDDGAIGIHHVA